MRTLVQPELRRGLFRPAILAGELVVPLADQRQAFVDAEDIAAVAVEALLAPATQARPYEVTGPDALTFAEAVAIISEATGCPIQYKGSPDDYRSANPAATDPEIAYFTNQLKLGDSGPTSTVQALTGRPPTPFPTYATSAAASGAWDTPPHPPRDPATPQPQAPRLGCSVLRDEE